MLVRHVEDLKDLRLYVLRHNLLPRQALRFFQWPGTHRRRHVVFIQHEDPGRFALLLVFLLFFGPEKLDAILVVIELLVADDQIARLVALDEYLDIRGRVNHLARMVQRLALHLQLHANLADQLRKLLNVVLHEVGLRFVVLLHTVKLVAILVPYLVDVRVNQLNVALVLLLGLAGHQLRMPQLLLQGWLDERGLSLARRGRLHSCLHLADLPLQLLQLYHLGQVILLGEEHLSAGLVQALPNLLRLLQQDAIRRGVVLAVQVGRLD